MHTENNTKKFGRRQITVLIAVILVIGVVVGGTVAWLTANTEPVVNTFTYGDIDLELDETKLDEDGEPVDKDEDGEPDRTTEGNEYEIIPGEEYTKDPEVTVLAGNKACWLFVKMEEDGGVIIQNADGSETEYEFDDYLAYEMEEGWTQLLDEEGEEVEGVYFRQVAANDVAEEGKELEDIVYKVIKDDKITVLGEVTKEMLNALDKNGEDVDNATYPTLSVTAFAVQLSGFEAEISDGAEEPTEEQMNAAALSAWSVIATPEEEQP